MMYGLSCTLTQNRLAFFAAANARRPVPAPTSHSTLSLRRRSLEMHSSRTSSFVIGAPVRMNASSGSAGAAVARVMGASFSQSRTVRSANSTFASSAAVPRTMRSSSYDRRSPAATRTVSMPASTSCAHTSCAFVAPPVSKNVLACV